MTDQTDHRTEAEALMAETAAMPDAVEHLLAAIHDEQREQTGLLTDLRGAIDDLAEVLRGPRETPEPEITWLPIAPGGYVAADEYTCEGCGRALPCRHCVEDDEPLAREELHTWGEDLRFPLDGGPTWSEWRSIVEKGAPPSASGSILDRIADALMEANTPRQSGGSESQGRNSTPVMPSSAPPERSDPGMTADASGDTEGRRSAQSGDLVDIISVRREDLSFLFAVIDNGRHFAIHGAPVTRLRAALDGESR